MAGIDVVVPAGGTLDAELTRVTGVHSKALIPFEGEPILLRLLSALRGSKNVRRIAVVGNPDVNAHECAEMADVTVPAVGSSPDNIAAGVAELSELDFPPDRVLIVTADLPFVTCETVDRFLELCPADSDFCVPLISRDDFEEAFPAAEATFVKLHDGEWTTGCMYLASIRGLKVAQPHLEKLFQNRKSKFKMAKLLGGRFVWQYLNRQLTVSDVERKVQELLNVRGSAIPGSPPELALDVDYAEDYHYVVSLLKGRTPQPTG